MKTYKVRYTIVGHYDSFFRECKIECDLTHIERAVLTQARVSIQDVTINYDDIIICLIELM